LESAWQQIAKIHERASMKEVLIKAVMVVVAAFAAAASSPLKAQEMDGKSLFLKTAQPATSRPVKASPAPSCAGRQHLRAG
jgi:hypothetical protein